MIARTAAADALVHAPRGAGRARCRRRSSATSASVGTASGVGGRGVLVRDGIETGAASAPRREHEPADRPADRAERRPLALARVRRVSAPARAARRPAAAGHDDQRDRDERALATESDELEQVPRGVEPEAEAVGELPHEERRPREARRAQTPRRVARGAVVELGPTRARRATTGRRKTRAKGIERHGKQRDLSASARSAAAGRSSSSSSEIRPPRQEALAPEEPADERQNGRIASPSTGQSVPLPPLGCRGGRSPVCGQKPTRPSTSKTTPTQSENARRLRRLRKGRHERQSPPARQREQVDDRRQERKQRRHEDELDRPPPDDPGAEEDVGRGARGELQALVERPEQLLRGAADLTEPVAAKPIGVSPTPLGGRSPDDVSVTAEIPRASSGACS